MILLRAQFLMCFRRNTNLRSFFLHGNELSAPFARDVVIASVRANTSLTSVCRLKVANVDDGEEEGDAIPELVEAEALVAAR